MDWLRIVFFGPMVLAQQHPLACFGLAAALIALQTALSIRAQTPFSRSWFRQPAVFAGALWVIYGLYELQVQAVTPEANIRIDLLVLTPILYVFTALAVWSLAVRCVGRASGEDPGCVPPADDQK